MKRSVSCLILVVACSSQPATPVEPELDRPRPAAVVVDAAPGVVAEVPLEDATPAPCFADDVLAALIGDRIVMCEQSDDDAVTATCHAFTADGTASELTGFAVWPSVIADEDDDGREWVDVCTAVDACVRLQPKLKGEESIGGAAVDQAGAEVAIAVDDSVEIWSTSTKKRLARTEAPGVEEIAYVGGALLIVTDDGAALWRRKGKKLVQNTTIDGDLRAWSSVDTTTAAFVLGDQIVMIETANGMRVGVVPWADLLGDTVYDRLHGFQIYGVGGKLATVVQAFDDHDDTITRVGVFALGSASPTKFEIPLCESHYHIDRFVDPCALEPLGCGKPKADHAGTP